MSLLTLFDGNIYFLSFFPIDLVQAILGGTIQVPTLTGDVVVKVCIHSSHMIILFASGKSYS